MPYDVGKDPYLDPEAGILRNLLGLTTQEELDAAEADITATEIAALTGEDLPIVPDEYFNADLLKEVHQQLFHALYDWSGQLRTVELTKDETSFARAEHLATSLDDLMRQLAADKYLAELDHGTFVVKLAHYYGELIVIHPFREGNGRAIRTFLAILADGAGWHIAWNEMDPQENIEASRAAYRGDETPLRRMLEPIVVTI